MGGFRPASLWGRGFRLFRSRVVRHHGHACLSKRMGDGPSAFAFCTATRGAMPTALSAVRISGPSRCVDHPVAPLERAPESEHVGSVAGKLRERVCEILVRAHPAPLAMHPELGTVSLDNEVPHGGQHPELVQIAPGRFLPESVKVVMLLLRTTEPEFHPRDRVGATVIVDLIKPDRAIDVTGGTLASGERDSRGKRATVKDETVAIALRSLMDHIVPCEEYGWRVDTEQVWEPEPAPDDDMALKRITQRMKPSWMDEVERLWKVTKVWHDAVREQQATVRAVADTFHVSMRAADDLIRACRDAGFIPEEHLPAGPTGAVTHELLLPPPC